MKTQRLTRNSDGSYSGSIGGELELDAQTTRKIRESLAKGPKHISAIAQEVGISMMHPGQVSALQMYLGHLLEHTKEIEMSYSPTSKGKRFEGWVFKRARQKTLGDQLTMAARKECKAQREARQRLEHKAKHARHRKNGVNGCNWTKQ
jgi:hypothetical protein